MSLETLKTMIPDYAKDIRLNIGSLANETILSDQQKYGCYLASAYAVGEPTALRAIEAEVRGKLSPEAVNAASAIMGMNNVYCRATHPISNETYMTMPARLRSRTGLTCRPMIAHPHAARPARRGAGGFLRATQPRPACELPENADNLRASNQPMLHCNRRCQGPVSVKDYPLIPCAPKRGH